MDIATYISDIFQNMLNVLQSITVFDILDILLLTYLIYMLFKLLRETRAEQLIKGIIFLVIIFIIVQLCQLKVMSFLLENFFQVGIIAIVIVFQPELRRILEHVGTGIAFDSDKDVTHDDLERKAAIEGITKACMELSEKKTGALIVIERTTRHNEIIEQGTVIKALPDPEIFSTIFYDGTPLHDGAVMIRDNRIYAAGCFLPLTIKPAAKRMGSRHRAAIGMTENSDAIVMVVSEETGTISCAEGGQLTTKLSESSIRKILDNKMPREAVKKKKLFGKPKSKTADNAEK